jgi:hypothetical protein
VRLVRVRATVAVLGIVGGVVLSGLATSPVAAAAYDNVNPETSACSNTAITALVANIYYGGSWVGSVELRYSTACRTVWARVNGPRGVPGDSSGPTGFVHRNSDGRQLSTSHCNSAGTSCWSNMLNDAGVTSYAKGTIDLSFAGPFSARTGNF